MNIRNQIDFLFNRWKKYEAKCIIIDETTNISEETWNKLKGGKNGNKKN